MILPDFTGSIEKELLLHPGKLINEGGQGDPDH